MDIDPVSQIKAARTDLTIGELIRRCNVSVRLANCIAVSPEISELTVPEFLADPAEWLNLFLQTRHTGQKIASELSALVAKAAADPETDPVSQIQAARTDLTIEGLARRCNVSVRLANCIAANSEISQLTVREFLADPARWLNQFLQTRSAGRKTASELSALVAKAAADPETFGTDPVVNQPPPREVAFGILVDLLKSIPFPAAFLQIEISMRLRHCLETIQAARLTAESWEPEADNLGAVLAGWPRIRPKLLKQANLGRKTVAELEAVIERIIQARLNACCSSVRLPETRIDDLSESQLAEPLIELLISTDATEFHDTLAQDQPELSTLLHGPDDDDLSPREHVREAVSRLTQKQQDCESKSNFDPRHFHRKLLFSQSI